MQSNIAPEVHRLIFSSYKGFDLLTGTFNPVDENKRYELNTYVIFGDYPDSKFIEDFIALKFFEYGGRRYYCRGRVAKFTDRTGVRRPWYIDCLVVGKADTDIPDPFSVFKILGQIDISDNFDPSSPVPGEKLRIPDISGAIRVYKEFYSDNRLPEEITELQNKFLGEAAEYEDIIRILLDTVVLGRKAVVIYREEDVDGFYGLMHLLYYMLTPVYQRYLSFSVLESDPSKYGPPNVVGIRAAVGYRHLPDYLSEGLYVIDLIKKEVYIPPRYTEKENDTELPVPGTEGYVFSLIGDILYQLSLDIYNRTEFLPKTRSPIMFIDHTIKTGRFPEEYEDLHKLENDFNILQNLKREIDTNGRINKELAEYLFGRLIMDRLPRNPTDNPEYFIISELWDDLKKIRKFLDKEKGYVGRININPLDWIFGLLDDPEKFIGVLIYSSLHDGIINIISPSVNPESNYRKALQKAADIIKDYLINGNYSREWVYAETVAVKLEKEFLDLAKIYSDIKEMHGQYADIILQNIALYLLPDIKIDNNFGGMLKRLEPIYGIIRDWVEFYDKHKREFYNFTTLIQTAYSRKPRKFKVREFILKYKDFVEITTRQQEIKNKISALKIAKRTADGRNLIRELGGIKEYSILRNIIKKIKNFANVYKYFKESPYKKEKDLASVFINLVGIITARKFYGLTEIYNKQSDLNNALDAIVSLTNKIGTPIDTYGYNGFWGDVQKILNELENKGKKASTNFESILRKTELFRILKDSDSWKQNKEYYLKLLRTVFYYIYRFYKKNYPDDGNVREFENIMDVILRYIYYGSFGFRQFYEGLRVYDNILNKIREAFFGLRVFFDFVTNIHSHSLLNRTLDGLFAKILDNPDYGDFYRYCADLEELEERMKGLYGYFGEFKINPGDYAPLLAPYIGRLNELTEEYLDAVERNGKNRKKDSAFLQLLNFIRSIGEGGKEYRSLYYTVYGGNRLLEVLERLYDQFFGDPIGKSPEKVKKECKSLYDFYIKRFLEEYTYGTTGPFGGLPSYLNIFKKFYPTAEEFARKLEDVIGYIMGIPVLEAYILNNSGYNAGNPGTEERYTIVRFYVINILYGLIDGNNNIITEAAYFKDIIRNIISLVGSVYASQFLGSKVAINIVRSVLEDREAFNTYDLFAERINSIKTLQHYLNRHADDEKRMEIINNLIEGKRPKWYIKLCLALDNTKFSEELNGFSDTVGGIFGEVRPAEGMQTRISEKTVELSSGTTAPELADDFTPIKFSEQKKKEKSGKDKKATEARKTVRADVGGVTGGAITNAAVVAAGDEEDEWAPKKFSGSRKKKDKKKKDKGKGADKKKRKEEEGSETDDELERIRREILRRQSSTL